VADCVFCSIAAGDTPAEVVLEEKEAFGFLDARPVFKGHVLLVPRAHVQTLADLPDDLLVPYFTALRRITAVMPEAFGAQGTWVAENNVVSQSVPHLHFHVVPRTKGDGLRGFFWPRTRYADGEAAAYAERLRAALG
jgi:histidine triad (HIT) family protein